MHACSSFPAYIHTYIHTYIHPHLTRPAFDHRHLGRHSHQNCDRMFGNGGYGSFLLGIQCNQFTVNHQFQILRTRRRVRGFEGSASASPPVDGVLALLAWSPSRRSRAAGLRLSSPSSATATRAVLSTPALIHTYSILLFCIHYKSQRDGDFLFKAPTQAHLHHRRRVLWDDEAQAQSQARSTTGQRKVEQSQSIHCSAVQRHEGRRLSREVLQPLHQRPQSRRRQGLLEAHGAHAGWDLPIGEGAAPHFRGDVQEGLPIGVDDPTAVLASLTR